ncbi:unnamed protein product [Periconia digitata]|uniref:Uncharacterized protein n=1 Tax=Periconia digitata TaxID=1303443 RepID=A0A9W4UTF9_9PLEO|nr:unnamed protein product [Periconia digitata]
MADSSAERHKNLDASALANLPQNQYQRLASAGLPIVLPWNHAAIRLGTGYHSSRQLTHNPWATESPFLMAELAMTAKTFHSERGTTSTFVSKKTFTEEQSNDHTVCGFGVGIAPAVPVVEVSVKGTFDQQVQSNSDSEKRSIHTTCRYGRIDLERTPRLTTSAAALIGQSGLESFQECFGDYYVAGYILGADTGMLLSASSFSRKEINEVSVETEARVLWFKTHATWSTEFTSFDAGKNVKVLGYDTLDDRTWPNHPELLARDTFTYGSPQHVESMELAQKDLETLTNYSENLPGRVDKILQSSGLDDGDYLTFEQCENLCKLGVVVELLLLPMARIREVIEWQSIDNTI